VLVLDIWVYIMYTVALMPVQTLDEDHIVISFNYKANVYN